MSFSYRLWGGACTGNSDRKYGRGNTDLGMRPTKAQSRHRFVTFSLGNSDREYEEDDREYGMCLIWPRAGIVF